MKFIKDNIEILGLLSGAVIATFVVMQYIKQRESVQTQQEVAALQKQLIQLQISSLKQNQQA